MDLPGRSESLMVEEYDATSDIESIFSAASLESTSSISTPISAIEVIDAASEALVKLLANDDALNPLCVAAVSAIKPDRFERNYRRLLRVYSVDLRTEASNGIQESVARFVRHRARYAARAIRRHFFVDEIGETLLHELVILPSHKSIVLDRYLSGIDTSGSGTPINDPSEISESSSDDEVETLLPDSLSSIESFLTEGDAFKRLRSNLRSYLTPSNGSPSAEVSDGDLILSGCNCPDIENGQLESRANIGPISNEESLGEDYQAGLNYLAIARTLPRNNRQILDILRDFFWYCLVRLVTYLNSLISRENWEQYSHNQSSFKLIYLYDSSGEPRETAVRLDTGSEFNLISAEKLVKLGRQSEVDYSNSEVFMRSANGETFQPRGSLDLNWSLLKGERIHTERFFVVDGCPEELLFSNRYVKKLGVIRYCWDLVLVDVFDKKLSETNADREAEKRRREEKQALQTKKKKASHTTPSPPPPPPPPATNSGA
jgi:hypothetical protein